MVVTASQDSNVLTDRDKEILAHVFRFRITTRDVLYRVFFEPNGLRQDAMTSVLRRLAAPYKPSQSAGEQEELAKRFHLFPRRLVGKLIYYHLTRLGLRAVARAKQVSPVVFNRLNRGLNHDSRAKRYAILSFCCAPGARRQKLSSREFHEHLAEYHVPRCPADSFYLDMSRTPPRLGLIRVDYARLAPKLAVARATEDLTRRLPNDHLRAKADAGQFVLSILTPTPERKHQLEQPRLQLERYLRDRLEIEVVPELNDVLSRRGLSR